MLINKFLAFKCIKDGRWSGMSLNNFYKLDMTRVQEINAVKKIICVCKYCGNKIKFHDKKKGFSRLNYKWFGDGLLLKEFIQLKNKERFKTDCYFKKY